MGEKFKTKFEKVTGGTEKQKDEAREQLQGLLENAGEDIPKKYEIPKTKKDIELIRRTENEVCDMARAYGASPNPLPLEKIHIVPNEKIHEAGGEEFGAGWHAPLEQYVVVASSGAEARVWKYE